jgi:hypothetical protein
MIKVVRAGMSAKRKKIVVGSEVSDANLPWL